MQALADASIGSINKFALFANPNCVFCIFFWRARVCWPLLCLCCSFVILIWSSIACHLLAGRRWTPAEGWTSKEQHGTSLTLAANRRMPRWECTKNGVKMNRDDWWTVQLRTPNIKHGSNLFTHIHRVGGWDNCWLTGEAPPRWRGTWQISLSPYEVFQLVMQAVADASIGSINTFFLFANPTSVSFFDIQYHESHFIIDTLWKEAWRVSGTINCHIPGGKYQVSNWA